MMGVQAAKAWKGVARAVVPAAMLIATVAVAPSARANDDEGGGFFGLFRIVLFGFDRTLNGSDRDDILIGGRGDDRISGRDGNDRLFGRSGDDRIEGGAGADELAGSNGEDELDGGSHSDQLSGGNGADIYAFSGDPFDGADVSAEGRQIIGDEDFVLDFFNNEDVVQTNAADFQIPRQPSFFRVDANVPGARIPDAANVIVLLNSDNDDNPETPFLAGTAANQIAALREAPGPGLFVYFNSNLAINRLVYSSDLSTADADLKIVLRWTDRLNIAATQFLDDFAAVNFPFEGDEIDGDAGDNDLLGFGGLDIINGDAGNDTINGQGAGDIVTGGPGSDVFVFDGDAFDGVDVSAGGRQIVGFEDSITDFAFGDDLIALNAADFDVSKRLVFASLDANAPDAAIPANANVIVLLNSDNDNDPATPFLAGTAANQIAALGATPGPGFFVYFNSNLQLNRLVYSHDLSTSESDLKIVARYTDLLGQDAIDALANFAAENFAL